jgi:hypothetical protein
MNFGKVAFRCRACRGRFHLKKPEIETPPQNAPKTRRRKSNRPHEPFWRRPFIRQHLKEYLITGCAIAGFAVFLYLLVRSGSGGLE